MSTQAVGAAAAGTAVIGGGGTLAAYAAGAFDPKVKESKQVQNTYKTLAEEELNASKEYIGGSKEKITPLLSGNTVDETYRDTLSGVWSKMDDTELKTKQNPVSRPDESYVKDTSKSDDVSDYANKWCEHISEKQLTKIPTDGSDKNTWDAFKSACFNTKKIS
ncbi:hypothetical protein [Candidatus Mycoplasma haematohominis]|uniref:Uncharacterized protein n=1 Tax=Candidatus Mycoplasma haematohominis TaxID=1494318 RepID=A0A478FTA7_9MOLU|nr:hypothetical protein [Candidatus Mycoplasma haemohominis]GCE63719.1 hypothetical protein MHSWG343_07190 [Candidatus Mycoplasma haemohominis]